MALTKPNPNDQPADNRRRALRGPGGLLGQLEDERVQVRRWAVRDLTDFPEAAKPLLEHLGKEPDESVREVILTSLMQIGGEQVVHGLLPYLKSEDAALRNGIVQVLQEIPEAVAPHMEVLLRDPDPDTRIFAVDIMREMRHGKIFEWLRTILEQDTHVNVCAQALDCLMEIGSADCIPLLQQIPKRFPDQPFIAFAVRTAIGRLQERS